MNPTLDLPIDGAERTVIPEESTHSTPTKEVVMDPPWIERLLYGCHPHVAVLDVWPESGLVAPAAAALGIPYMAGAPTDAAYDCVMGVLTQSKCAMSFCYGALRAWTSLNAGGYMALAMRPAVYAHAKRFLPPLHRSGAAPDGKRQVYIWRKPLMKRTRRTPKKTAAR